MSFYYFIRDWLVGFEPESTQVLLRKQLTLPPGMQITLQKFTGGPVDIAPDLLLTGMTLSTSLRKVEVNWT